MNPLPEDMDKECEKAAETIDNLINPEKSQLAIPKSILDKAKGLVVMHIVKAAVGFSGRAGTGIAVAKTADGSWSAPLAVAITGAGWGAQMGVLISDLVFVITNEDGIRAFSKGWNCTFGVNVAVALGPIGREGEIDLVLSDLAPVYTYSKSKGVFAGISLEGSVLLQRTSCNEAKYGAGVTGEAILFGQVPRPAGSEVLYQKLADLDAKAAKNAAAAAAKLAPTSAAPDF
ncbi:SH3 domain-containing YSC84-like protein 1 [Hyaloraphidium curvatum]|nr:SH3 domain-containing YSC84-like protein 1 [Hyaloraphidium curvatum]